MESTAVDDGLHHLLFFCLALMTRPADCHSHLGIFEKLCRFLEFIFDVLQQFLKGKIFHPE